MLGQGGRLLFFRFGNNLQYCTRSSERAMLRPARDTVSALIAGNILQDLFELLANLFPLRVGGIARNVNGLA